MSLPGFGMMMRMGVFGLEEANAPCQSHSGDKGDRQGQPAVGMEFHFREQVAQRDAQKNARRKGQGAAHNEGLSSGEFADSQHEEYSTQGTDQ